VLNHDSFLVYSLNDWSFGHLLTGAGIIELSAFGAGKSLLEVLGLICDNV